LFLQKANVIVLISKITIVIFGASSTNIFSKVPQILGLTRNVIIRDLWIVVNNAQKVESASVSEGYFLRLKHHDFLAPCCFSQKVNVNWVT